MNIIKPNTLSLVSCSVSETDAIDGTVWSSSTTYSTGALVRLNHVSYKSLQDNNANKNPASNYSGDNPYWQRIGATMPYRMLDDYVETVTEAPAGENLVFKMPFKRADSVALLNIHGVSAHFKITDALDGTVTLDEEYSLQDDIEALSLYDYYFLPITSVDTYVNTNIPITIDGILEITIRAGGVDSVASVGHVVAGRKQEIGETKYGAEMGITDYSKKNTDEFGVTTFIKRSYSKNASLSLFIPAYKADKVANILSGVHSMPILIVGGNVDIGHAALTIFGWIEDWRQVYTGPNENEVRVEIQGLI